MHNKKNYFSTVLSHHPSIHPCGALRTSGRECDQDKEKINNSSNLHSARPECFCLQKCIEGCIIKLTLFLFIFSLSLHAQNSQVITFISPRSQGFDTPRVVSGWDLVTHCPTQEKMYSTYAIAIEAASSFRPERINQCLFGQNVIQRNKNDTEWKDFIVVSGSQTEKRIPQKDWLADYFGLPTDFRSVVRFRPRVNNVIVEMQSFFGFNHAKKGLYAELFLPLVYTNWDLNMKECVTNPGENGYAPGYFNESGVDNTDLLKQFTQYISGCSVPIISGLTFHPLIYGKMSPCQQRAVHCAELRANLGYDHFIHDLHHIGVKMQVAAPLGNRPKGIYLFEPIVGNQHHWELGIGTTVHTLVWDNPETDEKVDFFVDATVNHIFRASQRRAFDLQGKPNSRYMLAQKMTSTISDNLTGNGITPLAQFDKEVTSIVNFTTRDIVVRVNVQADVALYCSYTHKNNYWTFGYNAWKRGCENISIQDTCNFPENTWAIKGDAQVFGFIGEQNIPTDVPIGTAVALSATESAATINYGTNLPKTGVSDNATQRAIQIQNALRNPNINFPQPAFAGNNQRLVASTNDVSVSNQINTSIQPVFINSMNIDINSASTSGFSHKIFTHYNHVITTHDRAHADIGLGSEIEFGRQAGPPPAIGDDKCINCALSFWAIWVKGGVSW
ncbi:MAG TPA: hypothetical protein VJJ26_04690 [Candidatus Babeliales bacterium]|nr:hypothetical protein [Candidatus Babeliales bacterium]